MSNLRFKVVEEAFKKRPVKVVAPKERPSEYFAKYVFNQEKMFKYLPLNVYKTLREVMETGADLPLDIADEVAKGMKQWAMEMGVTHCTHWFQPLTEGTAEKHDNFLEHPTLLHFPMVASVQRLRPAAIQLGILLRRCSSWETL